MKEPLIEYAFDGDRWVWSGALLRSPGKADKLAMRVMDVCREFAAMWPGLSAGFHKFTVVDGKTLRIELDPGQSDAPSGAIGIVGGFDVTVTAPSGNSAVFTAKQKENYLKLHGQWHLRRAIDVAHVGRHGVLVSPGTEPAGKLELALAAGAVGPLHDRADPDIWIEVASVRERDREDENNNPGRRPRLHDTESAIAAARRFLPQVETALSDAESKRLMERVSGRLGISGPHPGRLISVARSIAALDRSKTIHPAHLAEAVQYAPPGWRSRRNPQENGRNGGFEKPIHVYTRADAIRDGVLVDLMAVAPDICRQHYKYPVACTAAVWNLVGQAVRSRRWMNDINGVIHDILWMSRVAGRKVTPSTVIFSVIIRGAGRRSNHPLKLDVGPGDRGEPVITIMLPEED